MLKLALVGTVISGFAATIWAAEALPTGASLAFTSMDPVVVKARDMVKAGSFKEAETLLAAEAKTGDEQAQAARAEMAETIRRLRMEYAQTAEQMLAKVKRSIPDATAEDLERWRTQGRTQSRMVDGKVMYHSREPGAVLRACPEAKKRAAAKSGDDPDAVSPDKKKLLQHLKYVISEANDTNSAEVAPMRQHVTYTLTVKPNRPGAKAGSVVRAWLPYPQEYRQQKAPELIRTSPEKHYIAPNAMQGSEMTGARQRTIYFEQTIEDPSKPATFTAEYVYKSYAYYPQLKEELAKTPGAADPVYLEERPPHIVFTPLVKETVAKVVGDETNPLVKARKIFEFISHEIPWIPEQEYCVVPSTTLKGLETRMGDCGVQGSIFITMARCAGIPARWQSGWENKPGPNSMHDWAEMYIEPWGWLPVDASYGLQPSDDPKIKYFYLGHQDAYRTIFNLDYGWQLDPPKKSMRSEPMDFQRGEVEMDGRNLYFDEWSYNITFDTRPMKE